jgi:hypothetical protein
MFVTGVARLAIAKFLPVPDDGYSVETSAAHTRLVDSTRDTQPVVLRKNGYVIYDSHERAEVIAEVWNITPENIDSYKRWW